MNKRFWHVAANGRRLSGSGGLRSFTVGYFDSVRHRIPRQDFQLYRGGKPYERSWVRLPKQPPEKRWRVEVFGPDDGWVRDAEGSKAFCDGWFYGIVDALPHPATRLLDPEGEVRAERAAARTPTAGAS